jgi:hypothetical protein
MLKRTIECIAKNSSVVIAVINQSTANQRVKAAGIDCKVAY